MAELSTKPYLIRAIHQWCEDSGYRPYLAVSVDERTLVPREFVRNGEIVLNVSAVATHRLQIGNELIEFEARFSGAVRQVSIPIENVSAIYAQETGHGMAFDVPKPLALPPDAPASPKAASLPTPAGPRPSQRPKLVPKPAHEAGGSADTGSPARADIAVVPTVPPDSPALESVPSGVPPQEPSAARTGAAKGRRRAKLAAVPDAAVRHADGAPGSGPQDGGEPAGTAAGQDQTESIEPADRPAAGVENASPVRQATDEPTPDDPPPAPTGRPQLKRVK